MNRKVLIIIFIVCFIATVQSKKKKCKGRDCSRGEEDLEARQERERMECTKYCERMASEMQRDESNDCNNRRLGSRKKHKNRRRCNKSGSGSDSDSGSNENRRRDRKPEGCRYVIFEIKI